MDQRQRPGLTRHQLLQRMQHAPRLHRVASVKNVEPAGQNQFLMYHTVNTNGQNKEFSHTAMVKRI